MPLVKYKLVKAVCISIYYVLLYVKSLGHMPFLIPYLFFLPQEKYLRN